MPQHPHGDRMGQSVLLNGFYAWYSERMSTEEKRSQTESKVSDYPIEIYTDERIEEFLVEDKLTPELKKRLKKKLRQPIRKGS